MGVDPQIPDIAGWAEDAVTRKERWVDTPRRHVDAWGEAMVEEAAVLGKAVLALLWYVAEARATAEGLRFDLEQQFAGLGEGYVSLPWEVEADD
jgi:hypothetical protein